jgi:hypothetical protein
MCGRYYKLDLEDLVRHNVIEHHASCQCYVDKELLQHLLDDSRNPDVLTSNDLITFRAHRELGHNPLQASQESSRCFRSRSGYIDCTDTRR